MAFSPVDYYHLAGWLYSQSSPYNEACARAVISKSYYGAFLEARNRSGIRDKSSEVHKKVHDHYTSIGKLGLANRLDAARILRNEADYDTTKTITSLQSANALKQAKKILIDIGVAV